jgi:predicted ATPase
LQTINAAALRVGSGGDSGYFFALTAWLGFFLPFNTTSYYLPAARSGILQGHKALASSILSRVPLAGIEPLQVPTLSGVVADFLANILQLDKGKADPNVAEIGAFLEQKACGGTVDIGATEARFEYPEIYYAIMDSKLPLHRTSSMVSEIAPIILFLKYVVHRGDLLIIEEPEAHLHPDNQRTLAMAMVKLVRLGVRLIITTHSEYLLHQISNFVRLAGAASKRRELGYSENDYLLPAEVGSYLFCFGKNSGASHIKELKVTEEDGIPEDEFLRIAEAIYDETLTIERSLHH